MLKQCLSLIAIILLSFPASAFSQNSDQLSPAQQVYQNVSDSIFTLYGETEKGKIEALGSGVAIGENLLATNCHVALSGNVLKVIVKDKSMLGRLIYNKTDICLVEIPNAKFKPVKIKPSSKASIGEEVFAIGNPEGIEKTISNGIISNMVITKNNQLRILTTAATSPGSSGGGLFDKNSNLIGITTQVIREESIDQNLNVAYPTELILDYLNSDEETPSTETSPSNESVTTPSSTKNADTTSQADNISTIGYYGASNIGLIKLQNNKCLISIIGRRYEPNKIPENTSLIFYLPEVPNGLFIIPSTADTNLALKYFYKLLDDHAKSQVAHSILVFDKQLYDINYDPNLDLPYSAMYSDMKKDISENLMVDDDFFIQFYQFRGIPDMTTIRFDLDGFTEALQAYNKNCGHINN